MIDVRELLFLVQSAWKFIQAGVPQGFILFVLFFSYFLLFIYDVVPDIRSNIDISVDDISLFIIVENLDKGKICIGDR